MRDELRAVLARTDLPAPTVSTLRGLNTVLDADSHARLQAFALVNDRPFGAVSFGDSDSADLIVYLLHGTDTDLSAFPAWAATAQQLCADVIRACIVRGIPRHIAVIAWFAWDSGDHATVLATKHATIGAARLSIDLEKQRARNSRAHIAVVTFSYSSTLLGEMFALGMAGDINTAFSIASAGVTRAAGAEIAAAIARDELVVYATEAASDTTAPLGRLRDHPLDPRDITGVQGYGSDGGQVAGLDGEPVAAEPVHGHGSQTRTDEFGVRRRGYFDRQTESYLSLVARLAKAATDEA